MILTRHRPEIVARLLFGRRGNAPAAGEHKPTGGKQTQNDF
ncbi:MAG TPA: hypothetical protein VGY98_08360 [Verrucomicrobiae bacterium]|nr:hypothetical protein [Verrucomicrobiae bacterium]